MFGQTPSTLSFESPSHMEHADDFHWIVLSFFSSRAHPSVLDVDAVNAPWNDDLHSFSGKNPSQTNKQAKTRFSAASQWTVANIAHIALLYVIVIIIIWHNEFHVTTSQWGCYVAAFYQKPATLADQAASTCRPVQQEMDHPRSKGMAKLTPRSMLVYQKAPD